MQKFRLLATQCAAAGSQTQSPTSSPVIHLRRRKTLRMLLGRGGDRKLPPRCDDDGSSDDTEEGNSSEKPKELSARHKLKDLFISSPPAFRERVPGSVREGLLSPTGGSGGGVRRKGPRSLRPMSAAFRQRLLRRAWRPALVAIPE